MIKQGVCFCALLTVAGCIHANIKAVETDSGLWDSYKTKVGNAEIQYKLPPSPNPNIKGIPEKYINFSDESAYSIANGHKWARVGSFGYEYDQDNFCSLSNFKLTVLVGQVGVPCHDFDLGGWLFKLRTTAHPEKTIYFSSCPKKKGQEVVVGMKWYHELGYKLIEPGKSAETSNVIVSDLYSKMIDTDTYLILVFNYIKGIKSEDHNYRHIAKEIVRNVQVSELQ